MSKTWAKPQKELLPNQSEELARQQKGEGSSEELSDVRGDVTADPAVETLEARKR